MKSIKTLLQKIPFYPVLLGLYPVLYLWQANFIQILASNVLRSLIVSIGVTLLVCLVCLAVFRKLQTAAAMAGLVLVLFFTYGHVFSLVDNLTISGFVIGRHRFLLLVWGALLGGGAVFILRAKSELGNLTLTANLVSSLLVGVALVQLGMLTAGDPSMVFNKPADQAQARAVASTQAADPNTPDVYYFLLDGYARQDVLKSDIHLDNQPFISDLENLGFYVPDCAQSNYTSTVTSMGATLNMNYFEALGVPDSDVATMDLNKKISILQKFTLSNQVMRDFRQLGYKIVTLSNPYRFIDYPNSDVYIDYQSATGPLNTIEAYNFEYIFLQTTMARILVEAANYSPARFQNLPFAAPELVNPKFKYAYSVYSENLYNLKTLEGLASLPGKKFVYAHVLATHPPYTFTPSGEFNTNIDSQYSVPSYANQITYVDKRMLTIIKNILAGSKVPPVIILQGDHGDAVDNQFSPQKFKILNAYYLPQNGKSKIYATITPVNTFRLVFSEYFGRDLPLLPDHSIWVDPHAPNSYVYAPSTCVH